MNKKGKLLVALLILIVLIVFGVVSSLKNKKAEQPVVEEQPILARFECANSSFIDAEFINKKEKTGNSVNLVLSDERKFSLMQVISASGARYANADESFVFWNKGDTAFIEEGGKITYTDCAVKAENTDTSANTDTNIVGGDVDAHGCLASAGYSWCAVKNKCLRTWEESCAVSNPVAPKNYNKTTCEKDSGVWFTDNNTCEINSYSKTQCEAKGGEFNECASACRHNPGAEVCTMQCVLTCTFK